MPIRPTFPSSSAESSLSSMGIGIDEYVMALSVLERMTLNAERLVR
ncbi:hypothetical protein [Arthrobacter bambusae]|nr:hypothetical protein [Arthrobacter bambusae]MDQ0031210.1 hypothetical protein [Arthrobacter bambusae]MDQ0099500.1 hypothetical protein [Arthrobacter bambusae]